MSLYRQHHHHHLPAVMVTCGCVAISKSLVTHAKSRFQLFFGSSAFIHYLICFDKATLKSGLMSTGDSRPTNDDEETRTASSFSSLHAF